MTEFGSLNENNIFVIPAGDYFGHECSSHYLIYSPLAGCMFIASPSETLRLDKSLSLFLNNEPVEEQTAETFKALLDFTTNPFEMHGVSSPDEYKKLSLIPNYKCNFSCSYCYSAAGRSNREISPENLKAAIDYFVDRKRVDSDKLKIFISGGGEPLLSWDILKAGLEYAYSLAEMQGITLETLIMTNGSLIDHEMISFFKRHNIGICVSFEIIEEIQNLHRKNYRLVASNIRMLTQAGLKTSISSTITKESVFRQEEMFQTALEQFPGIDGINFDPVLAPDLFDSPDDLKEYFNNFICCFLTARRSYRFQPLQPYCSMLRLIDDIIIRYCPGKLCVTPESTITVCHSITSPKEKGYSNYIYGKINGNLQPEFDLTRFSFLINDNIFNKPECAGCFAKWHCGGGCIMQNSKYDGRMKEAMCWFTREFIRQLLLERLSEEYLASEGISLHDVVLNQMNNAG